MIEIQREKGRDGSMATQHEGTLPKQSVKEQQNCSSNVNILGLQGNRADVKIFASDEHAVVSSALANVVQRRVL